MIKGVTLVSFVFRWHLCGKSGQTLTSFSKHVSCYAYEQLAFFCLDIKEIQGEEGMNNKQWMFLGLSILSLQGPYSVYLVLKCRQ